MQFMPWPLTWHWQLNASTICLSEALRTARDPQHNSIQLHASKSKTLWRLLCYCRCSVKISVWTPSWTTTRCVSCPSIFLYDANFCDVGFSSGRARRTRRWTKMVALWATPVDADFAVTSSLMRSWTSLDRCTLTMRGWLKRWYYVTHVTSLKKRLTLLLCECLSLFAANIIKPLLWDD